MAVLRRERLAKLPTANVYGGDVHKYTLSMKVGGPYKHRGTVQLQCFIKNDIGTNRAGEQSRGRDTGDWSRLTASFSETLSHQSVGLGNFNILCYVYYAPEREGQASGSWKRCLFSVERGNIHQGSIFQDEDSRGPG